MIYVLIGILVAIIIVLLASQGEIDSVVICYGLLMAIGLSLCFTKLGKNNGYSDPEYQSMNSTYNIQKIQESKYYILSSDGDSVSVLSDKESGIKKETFPEDIVTFVETNDSAKVDINLKVFQKPSKSDEIWFNKLSEPNEEFPEKIYESVTIYIPKRFEPANQIPEVESNEQKLISNKEVFCNVCGTKIDARANFCSGCGAKVK